MNTSRSVRRNALRAERAVRAKRREHFFAAILGDRLLGRYSDGGPAETPDPRRRARRKAARAARRRNRSAK